MKTIISLATRLIPRHYLQHVSHFFLQIFSLFLRGNKYDISLYLNVDIRVIKGLNIFGWGSFNLNRSQIELPSSGSNYEEVLLRQKQLASSYNYYTSIGLSYTFGSLYNNIVNTRFD